MGGGLGLEGSQWGPGMEENALATEAPALSSHQSVLESL